MLEKFRGDVLKNEDIIRRGTRLTGIKPTPKGDATGCNPQISRRMDDGWIFSAEFEYDRRQLLSRRSHDDPGDRRPAGKKDVVPVLFEQCGGFGNRAENDRKRVAIQVLRKKSRDSLGSRGRHFRRFNDSSVTSGDGRD